MRPSFVYAIAAFTALLGIAALLYRDWLGGGFLLSLAGSVVLNQRAAATDSASLKTASQVFSVLALVLLAADIVLTFT